MSMFFVAVAVLLGLQHAPAARVQNQWRENVTWAPPFKDASGVTLWVATRRIVLYDPADRSPGQRVLPYGWDLKKPLVEFTTEQLARINRRTTALPWRPGPNFGGVLTTYLGSDGVGHWYAKGSLGFLESAARYSGLRAGEAPTPRAIRALGMGGSLHSEGYTSLVRLGDEAIASLVQEHRANRKSTKASIPAILGQIRTRKAALALLEMYRRGDRFTRSEVSSAAHYRPYLPQLKPAYLDTLKAGRPSLPAAEAVAQFGWREALPWVRRQLATTTNLDVARASHLAVQTLTSQSITKEEREASRRLLDYAGRPGDEQILAASRDRKFVALCGLSLLNRRTKSGNLLAPEGRKVLEGIPRPLIERLAKKYRVRTSR